jgi:nucleotide-binding universal stress UspA family protein
MLPDWGPRARRTRQQRGRHAWLDGSAHPPRPGARADHLRSMLVALDGSAHSATATTLALDWARRFRARLLGLGVLDEPSIRGGEAVPLGAGAYKQAPDQARMADAHRRVMAFLEEFRTRSADAGVLEDVGHPADRSCARRSAPTW